MPTIDINDAYILDNTGLQVDQSVDYAYANSNKNLLDNPFFTVRQRGDGPFTGNVYGVDRWRGGNSRTTITGASGYITLSTNSSGNGILRQILPQTYEGTYTFSAVVGGSGSGAMFLQDSGGTIIGDAVEFTTTGSTQLVTLTFTTSGTAIGGVAVRVNVSNTISVVCAKLELGPYSTLVNDTPPNYAEELAKCQRYFYRMTSIGSAYPFEMGFATSATNFRVVLPTHCSMNTPVQSVTMNGGNFYAYGGGVAAGLTSVSYTGWVPNGIVVTFVTSGLTSAVIYALMCNNASSYIDISCDL